MDNWAVLEWQKQLQRTDRREVRNTDGVCELIESRTPGIVYTFPDRTLIARNIRLIYGIGEVTAAKLRADGYQTLEDLLSHSRWRKAAAEILQAIGARKVRRLEQYGAADLELLGFFAPEEMTFLDIETLGLFYMYPVFLIGTLRFENGTGIIRQYLARDYTEEAAILAELAPSWRNLGVLVSYNGRSFDIPYLKGRLRANGQDDRFDAFHLDLLKYTRRRYRPVLPDCRLVTVECCLLGQKRRDDLPGSEAPEHYLRFLDTGERCWIEPILTHNAADLLALAQYLGLILKIDSGQLTVYS
ncbi:MAG: ribonuclease H-like domain-containing protein [Bacillota bacterium]|jgi:uncharacterized protein YprB with RNaseH-like and TPR domain